MAPAPRWSCGVAVVAASIVTSYGDGDGAAPPFKSTPPPPTDDADAAAAAAAAAAAFKYEE